MSFSLSPLQISHILASSIATALYIPVFVLGWSRFRGSQQQHLRTWHIRLGIAAFVFRAAGFILMFSLLGNHAVHK